jgi:tripartite-type tricarboxylate transporter receptor subunit TctC
MDEATANRAPRQTVFGCRGDAQETNHAAERACDERFCSGFEAGSWWGLAAPKDTPHEIVHVLGHATNAVLSDPRMKIRLAELDTTPLLYGSAPFAGFVEMEPDKWTRVLKFSGTKED